MKKLCIALIFVFISIPLSAFAAKPDGSVYLDGGSSKYGLILAHGRGKSPTWFVVDPVRKAINNKLGYHTLSLQMPTGYDNWKDYARAFPEAYSTIEKAIEFLKKEKGVTHVYLLGHSMGARMASAFVAAHPDSGISGLIVAGCRNGGDSPLACDQSLQWVDLPVLDIWGDGNKKDSIAAAQRTGLVSDTYTQVAIAGADHRFEYREDELVSAVASWLKSQN